MRTISEKNKQIIDTDPYYKKCARHDEGNCAGRITIEHALIYGSRQVDEIFALLPICEFHHAVNMYQDCGDLNKEKHEWIALSRATEKDFQTYYKSDWRQRLKYLNTVYGIYK